MPNKNPWYKVYVGDDLRLAKALSTDAYGLYGILRNWVHDADPYAHLVDAHGVPMTDDALIDLSGLKASAFRAAFQDLSALKAVQSAREWLVEIRAREHDSYIAIAQELVVGVRQFAVVGSADQGRDREVLLVPALADQYVRSVFGRNAVNKRHRTRTDSKNGGGLQGGLPVHLKSTSGGTSSGTSSPPLPHIHEHEHDNAFDLDSGSPVLQKEKEKTSNAGAQENVAEFALRSQPGRAPWSWEKHLWLCDQVRKLELELESKHPEALEDPALYESHFFGRLKLPHAVFVTAQEFYQHGPKSGPVPQPCIDGHHVPDSVTGRCVYCGGRPGGGSQ